MYTDVHREHIYTYTEYAHNSYKYVRKIIKCVSFRVSESTICT